MHAEIAWLTSLGLRSRRDRILVTVAGVAPDLDGLALLGGEQAYGTYHHLLTHGFVAALATTAICAGLADQRRHTALLALLAFHLHLLCDLAGSGPGWPLYYFWPVNRDEWMWSGQWDLASWQNSVIGMTATFLCLAAALKFRRTFVEVFSLKWDGEVTRALRQRFLKEKAVPGAP